MALFSVNDGSAWKLALVDVEVHASLAMEYDLSVFYSFILEI